MKFPPATERLTNSGSASSEEAPIVVKRLKQTEKTDPSRSLPPSLPPSEQHLTRIMQILSESRSPEATLLSLTAVLGEIFQIDSCLIMPLESGRSPRLVTCWATHHPAHFSVQPQWLNHPGLYPLLIEADMLAIGDLTTLQNGTSLVASNESIALSSHTASVSVRAVLGIATQFQGCRNGTVVLGRSHPHCWTELEIQQLQALTDAVAIAIAQIQFQQQLQQQTQYQNLISQLTEAIRISGELDHTFQLALEGAVSALQISRGLVLLLRYTAPPIKHRTPEGLPSAKVNVAWEYRAEQPGLTADQNITSEIRFNAAESSQTFWLSECQLCQQVLIEAKPLLMADTGVELQASATDILAVSAASTEFSAIAPVFQMQSLPALLLVPLTHQNTVLGYLALQHDRPCFWQPELAFAQLVANQLSTAIIQSQTLRQIHGLVEERTAQLQRSLEVQAKLYERSRQQIEQLRQLNQLKDEFLSTMSHELLTPLTSMTLAIRMLREADLPPERQMKYLDILEKQCVHETSLINDLLALQKLDSRSVTLPLQKLDIRSVIQNSVQSFEEQWAKKELKLAVDLSDRSLTVHSNPDDLTRILIELLTNAGKYAEPGSTIRLRAVPEVNLQLSGVVLTLYNVGAAIRPKELPHIFDRFRRGQGATQQAIPGTGLGLALVKSLVEHLQGSIAASSRPLRGEIWETCFTLTLPQFPHSAIETEILD